MVMEQIVTAKAKARLFGLVRDKDGNPKIDDWATLPAEIKQMLTPEERAKFEAQHKGDSA